MTRLRIRSALAATLLATATTLVLTGNAHADGEDTWTYWGDDVSPTTGEKSVTFDNGGITPTQCLLTFRVKRYPDAPNAPGWLEPILEYRCDATAGRVADVGLSFHSSGDGTQLPQGKMFIYRDSGTFVGRTTGEPGEPLCITAAAIKNGSYTGAGVLTICGRT